MFDTKKLALFLGGVVFGSAGFKVLSSKDAKKVYTQTTAAVLRMKDCTMQTVNKVQEEAVTSLPMQRPSTRAAPPRLHRRLSRIRLKKSSPQSDMSQRSRRFRRLFFTQRGKKSNEMYDLT